MFFFLIVVSDLSKDIGIGCFRLTLPCPQATVFLHRLHFLLKIFEPLYRPDIYHGHIRKKTQKTAISNEQCFGSGSIFVGHLVSDPNSDTDPGTVYLV